MGKFCKRDRIINQNLKFKIKILILNWNGKNDTIQCLESLEKQLNLNQSILLIDNGSTDGSVSKISKLFPNIEILQLRNNFGFSGGMNKGLNHLKKDKPDFVIFMNNDIIASDSFLEKLLNGINQYGKNNILSPLICYHSDKDKIWYGGGQIKLWRGKITHSYIRKKISDLNMKSYEITDYVSGCCLAISWDLINKLNGFNESFNMYSEDVDLCIRAKKLNAKCYVVTESVIWHKISKSIGGNLSFKKNLRKLRSTIKLINLHSNFFNKLTGILGLVIISIIHLPKILIHNSRKKHE